MTLSEEIKKQLRAGHGLRFDPEANSLYRAVGRKKAQQDADSASLDALDASATKAEQDAAEEQTRLDNLSDPGGLPEDPTEEERAAYEAYRALVSKKQNFLAVKSKKEEQAASIRARHNALGEQKVLNADPKRLLLKDFSRFIERNVGPSACKECCDLIEAYLEEKPTATLVKIKNFNGDAVVIADIDGTIVCRAGVVVVGG